MLSEENYQLRITNLQLTDSGVYLVSARQDNRDHTAEAILTLTVLSEYCDSVTLWQCDTLRVSHRISVTPYNLNLLYTFCVTIFLNQPLFLRSTHDIRRNVGRN